MCGRCKGGGGGGAPAAGEADLLRGPRGGGGWGGEGRGRESTSGEEGVHMVYLCDCR